MIVVVEGLWIDNNNTVNLTEEIGGVMPNDVLRLFGFDLCQAKSNDANAIELTVRFPMQRV